MSMVGCYGARNLVAVRAARVEADGSRICPNVDGGAAMTGGVLTFSAAPQIDTGQTDLQRDGDGNVCNTRTSSDLVTGINLTLDLCILDFEMIETLTGGIIAVTAGDTYGWEYAKGSDTQPHNAVDVWSRTWAGAGPAATASAYSRFTFYNTTWVPGQFQVQENALSFPLTGKAAENSNISIGPFDDIPPEFVGSFGGIWFTAAADLPADPNPDGNSCGYIDVPACSTS